MKRVLGPWSTGPDSSDSPTGQEWGLLHQLSPFVIHSNYRNFVCVLIIYHVRIELVTPAKCDSTDPNDTFVKSENVLTEKLVKEALVTPPLLFSLDTS